MTLIIIFALLWLAATVYALVRAWPQIKNAPGEKKYPVCKPKLGTRICTRCGREITAANRSEPCPAVPLSKRW